jgi:hypothetical protein
MAFSGTIPGMQRSLVIVAVVAAGCGAGAAGGPPPPPAAPALKLVRAAPLEFRGTGFRAGDRVGVVVSVAQIRRVRRVTAAADGSFRVRFDPFLALDVCRGSVVVTATGSRGEKAIYRRQCRPPDPALPSSAPA